MSLTHLKGLQAGALKLGQDHTQTWEYYRLSHYPVAAVVEMGTADNTGHTAADNTGHTAADHNQVGCKLPAVEHYKPQPSARALQHIYPSDKTAYKPSSQSLPSVSPYYPSSRTSLASMLCGLSG
ncbi:hypothetical protein Tco_0383344 [Tanacetum coccineum]